MSSSRLVLVLGHDNNLLETRRMVLERAGFKVLTAQRIEEAQKLATISTVDLLLLCHTLSDEDLRHVLSYIKVKRVTTKLLLVTTVTRGAPEGPWETVDALAGAQKMIFAAHHALEA